MLAKAGKSLKGATVAISGFGNVAWGAATKATELGAKVIAISGPDGVIYNPNGMTPEKIDYMLELAPLTAISSLPSQSASPTPPLPRARRLGL